MPDKIESKIKEYEKKGIQLWIKDEKLKYRSKMGVVPAHILEDIKSNKERIIACLKNHIFELTPIQHAYFIGSTADCELGGINAQYYVEYRYPNIDISKMEAAINEVIQNNPALMTVIDPRGYQRILVDTPEIQLPVEKLMDEKDLIAVREIFKNVRYHYGEWPMFHFQISKFQNQYDILHVSFDCIILDAWSAKLMVDEIFQVYSGIPISYPHITFEEYLKRSKKYLENSQVMKPAKEYWEHKVVNMPQRPVFQCEKSIPEIKEPHFNRLDYKFSKEETLNLYMKIKKYRFTPSAVICGGYAHVLSKYCTNKNFTINLTIFNRNPVHEDIETVLGDFTNIGFVSYMGEEHKSLLEEIKEIQGQLWKLVQFRAFDGTQILKKPSKYSKGKAIMPVVFTGVLQGISDSEQNDNEFQEQYAISQTPQVMLDHQARDDEGKLYLSWDYVKEAFEQRELEIMFFEYIEFIKLLIAKENWDEIC